MIFLAIAIIGLGAVSAIELVMINRQGKRINELEADKRIEIAFYESEEQENV